MNAVSVPLERDWNKMNLVKHRIKLKGLLERRFLEYNSKGFIESIIEPLRCWQMNSHVFLTDADELYPSAPLYV